jgi:hypothetical protein
MPLHDGFRLDDGDGASHRGKQPIEPDEDQSVGHRELRLCGQPSTQHVHLMPQQDDLGFQARAS